MGSVRSSRSCLVLAFAFAVVACGDDGGAADAGSTGSSMESTSTMSSTRGTGSTGGSSEGESGLDESGSGTGMPMGCEASTPQGLAECVEQERYLADLEFIALPREPGSAHWQAVQDLCVERFTEYGFEVELHTYATGINVVGRKLGTRQPAEEIVFAAHYDHVEGCNGADDNGTGVAGVLEAARVLSSVEFPRTLVVACWDEEEDGKVGSEAYVADAVAAGDEILFNYNFEMIGYRDDTPGSQELPAGFELLFPAEAQAVADNDNRGDFLAVIVDEPGSSYVEPLIGYAAGFGLSAILIPAPADLVTSEVLGDIRRSDHAAFWDQGISATMLTDTANFRNTYYHCASGQDDVERLDHEFATQIIASTVGAAAESLGLAP